MVAKTKAALTIEAKVEHISPAMAKSMLGTMVSNRKLIDDVVKAYARDMENDNWELNGEPIIFDEDGSLIDGQHRLTAIIKARKAIRLLVVRGTKTHAFKTIDSGVKREFSHVLHVQGFADTLNISAATSMLRRILVLEAKQLRGGYRQRATNQELEAYFFEHKYEILRAMSPSIRTRDWLIRSVGAVVFILCARVDFFEATAFFDDLHTGALLLPKDPVLQLRKCLFERKLGRPVRREPTEQYHLAIHAWNIRRQGKPGSVYERFRRSMDRGELPKPV